MNGRALIVEGTDDRAALVACRALASEGWTVGVASSGRPHLAASSKFASARHRVPAPQKDLDGFVAGVRAAVERGGYEVVFPGWGDAETAALSIRRDEIPATVPFCSHDRLMGAFDKLRLCEAASRAGLTVPETRSFVESDAEELRYPLVVKARLHAPLADDGGPSRIDAAVARDAAEARRLGRRMRIQGGEPIAQELVKGPLGAFVAVTNRDSRVIARGQQVADLTWPPGIGRTARGHTVEVDEELAKKVSLLLAELCWFGVVQLQFILCPSRGPTLIDFNGRFYGSLSLVLAAGPNLPAIWAACATDRPMPAGGDATPGCLYQSLDSDLRRAGRERRGGLLRDTLGCLRYASFAHVQDVWDRKDPRPALHMISSVPESAGGRVLARREGLP